MMKNIWLIALISIILSAVSCSGDEPETIQPILSVEPVALSFTTQAIESHEVTVTTNQSSWGAVSSQSWCTITKGNGKFTVTATANTSTSPPEPAVITVTAGNAKPVTVHVTQSGVGAELSVSPNTPITFTGAGGANEAKTITVNTNQPSWDATSGQPWCVVAKSAGTFTVTVTPNTGLKERKAMITVSAGNASNVTIEVTQVISSTAILEIDKTELYFEAENATPQSLIVTTNDAKFTRSYPGGWCQEISALENKDGTYTLKYTADDNPEEKPRSITIKIQAGDLTKNVNATQAAFVPKENIGDYCYSDGSFSKELNSSKTCIGVVIVNKTPKRSGLIVSHDESIAKWSSNPINYTTYANSSSNGAENQKKIQAQGSNWAATFPAFAWCAQKGDGWYLPAEFELEKIIKAKGTINSKLISIPGGIAIDDLSHRYWSSSEHNGSNAWCGFDGKIGISLDKRNDGKIRAVRVY